MKEFERQYVDEYRPRHLREPGIQIWHDVKDRAPIGVTLDLIVRTTNGTVVEVVGGWVRKLGWHVRYCGNWEEVILWSNPKERFNPTSREQ